MLNRSDLLVTSRYSIGNKRKIASRFSWTLNRAKTKIIIKYKSHLNFASFINDIRYIIKIAKLVFITIEKSHDPLINSKFNGIKKKDKKGIRIKNDIFVRLITPLLRYSRRNPEQEPKTNAPINKTKSAEEWL